MENKEKRKRRVSILTVFIWLALIVTMSVVAISGISKSNALEDDESQEITIKIDFTELIQNEEIEESEVETFLEDYTKNILMANVIYVESEQNKIGIYKGNKVSSLKYIGIYSDGYYDFINNDEVLGVMNISSGRVMYYKDFIEDIDEYNFVVKKKETRRVTVKIDFNDLIKNRGITEQSEVETLLSKYYTRLTGRKDKYSLSQSNPINEYINLKSKYIRSEKNTIGIYEIEIPEDIKYIQVVKSFDPEYLEISFLEYDMFFEGRPLEITRISENAYIDFSKIFTQPYVLPVIDNVDEYNIDIKEKEEITVNLSSDITKVDVVNNTSKIIERIVIRQGKFNLKLSKDAEYDLIFVPEDGYITKYRGIYEDDNELEQKMVYTPSANKEMYNYYKTIKQGENKPEYTFDTSGRFESSIVWEDNKKAKLNFKIREVPKYYYIFRWRL